MLQRSLFIRQLIAKFTLSRNYINCILLLGDLGGALCIGWFVRALLPEIPRDSFILQVWCLAITALWLITADIDKNFRLDFYLTYTRVFKIAWWAGLSYSLFFLVTRTYYSLKFLLITALLWILFAILVRWLLRKFLSPAKGLSFENLPDTVLIDNKVIWNVITDPKNINLKEFDFLAIDFSKPYSVTCQEALTHAHIAGVPILSLPQIVEHLTGKISVEHLNDTWVETTFYLNPLYLRFKRILDIVITVLLLPILLPLILAVGLFIFITMGRPIFFWQQRVGINNNLFSIVKFRTMVADAEKAGAAFADNKDQRVTKYASWLRKLRLDELPQFYNVFKGDMSIIGPRPEQALFVEKFNESIPLYQVRHWLRPGITGWAQVMHGYASNEDETLEKLRYDMFYLKNISFWLDLVIMFKTALTIVTGFGSR